MNIQLPTSTVTDIGLQVSTNLTSFKDIVILLISLFLAFVVIEFIIDTVIKVKKNE